MIQFPLHITYYPAHNGRWKAYINEPGLEMTCEGHTSAEALGRLFLQMKDVPGFHLWTFNIVGLMDDDDPTIHDPNVSNPSISLAWKVPTAEEMDIYVKVGKINAIKAYRGRTGLGLREAKETIERQAAQEGLPPK